MRYLISLLCCTFLLAGLAIAQQPEGARPTKQPVTAPAPLPINEEKIAAPLVERAEFDDQKEKSAAALGAGLVLIEGAVYTVIGDTIVPLPGGGASGCFAANDSATAARLQRARAEYAQRLQKD